MMQRELRGLFIWNAEGAASGVLHSGIILFFGTFLSGKLRKHFLCAFFFWREGGGGLELVSKQDVDQHVKVFLLGNTQRQRRGAGWFCPHLLVWTIQANKQTNKQH